MLNEQATRSNGRKLKVKQCKKDVRKHFLSLRAILIGAPSINSFKNQLDNYMGGTKYTVYPNNGWVKKQEGVI